MSLQALPTERYLVFLWVRRGIPLFAMLMCLLESLLHPLARGWWILGAAICFGVAWPTFKHGDAYLRARQALVRFDGIVVRLFRPLARFLGREDDWILSFCGWNNRRVRECFEGRKARRPLLLLPHCIQLARCKADIFEDLSNCYSCGLCSVEDILRGTLEQRWDVTIHNRSHKAYRAAREFHPDFIVAVSCADRLLKGLTRLPEVPAYVLPLTLDHGWCVDTSFDVSALVTAMDTFMEPRRAAKIQPLDREGIA
jgi:hypothetical protein